MTPDADNTNDLIMHCLCKITKVITTFVSGSSSQIYIFVKQLIDSEKVRIMSNPNTKAK